MKSDDPQLVETGRGYSVTFKERHLYSLKNPCQNILRSIEQIDIQQNTLVFIPSPLLFYGMDELLLKIGNDCHMLCVECNEELMAFSVKHCPSQYLEENRITFVRTTSIQKIVDVVERQGVWRFRRVLLIRISGAYSLFRETYDNIFKALDLHIQQYWQNRMTLMYMGKLWIRNVLQNLISLPDCSSLNQINVDRSMLVVGAGESLEYSLPLIEKYRKELFILCVDTAFPVLISCSIIPDMILAVEAQFSNYLDFLQAKKLNIPVLCDLSSNPTVMRFFKKPKYLFISRFSNTRFFDRMKLQSILPVSIPPLGSVGVVAVYFALKLTTGPIFLTGLDFSFVRGKPHSRGAPSHTLSISGSSRINSLGWYKYSLSRPLIDIKGKNGKSRSTDVVLYNYSQTLAAMIRDEKRVFDLSQDGLAIGAPLVADESKFSDLLKTKPAKPKKPFDGPHSNGKIAVLEFIASEIDLIKKLNRIADMYLGNPLNESTKNALKAILDDLDYLFIHFPDTPPVPKIEKSFLMRCLSSAEDYLSILGQTQDNIHQNY